MTAAGTPTTDVTTAARTNPYVGPRAFRYGERLYGRTRELGEISDLLVAERIVLLYSPSGAGKSSLLEAGLRATLGERDFAVLPTIRVGHDVPPVLVGLEVRNRYVLSTLLSLEEGRAPEQQLTSEELARARIADYLQRWEDELSPGADPCLLFDQFEEFFTVDPTDQPAKASFLDELGAALRDRGRWVLFAMREEFVAQLDPYVSAMPSRFSSRYRLDLLGPAAARLAMQAPARAAAVEFTDAAANLLVDDLRRVTVQRGEIVSEDLGAAVEPVQLQVVCRRLWDTLPADATTIEPDDVAALGDVDNALADYYDDRLRSIATSTGVAEREIRGWVDDALITAQGFRAQALDGPGADGLTVLRELEDAHLVRADQRRGARWYELAHDRLVQPIRASNSVWGEEHLSPLQREAQFWDSQSRPQGLLMRGEALTDAEAWAAGHPDELSRLDHDYLDACRAEAERADRERRAARRTRRLAVLATIVGLIAIVGLVAALLAWNRATDQERRANRQAAAAARAADAARAAEADALAGQQQARAAEIDALAVQARLLATTDPPLAVALAAEVGQRRASPATERAIAETRDALARNGVVTTLVGPESGLLAVTMSPDGAMVAGAGWDGSVTVWDPASGQERPSPAGHDGAVSAVAFSPDGSTLASAGLYDGTVTLWDPVTGNEKQVLTDHTNLVLSVAFSRDGSVLASAGYEYDVRLWDPASGASLGVLPSDAWLNRVAVSPDGSIVAGVATDGTVRLWDRQPGDPVRPPRHLEVQDAASVAFSPDGFTLATGGRSGVVTLWDPVSGARRASFGGRSAANAVAFSDDGSLLATGSDNGEIALWAPADGRQVRSLVGHHSRVTGVAWGPGSMLASSSYDGTVKVWNAGAKASVYTSTEHRTDVTSVAFVGDGSMVASADRDDVWVWNETSGEDLPISGDFGLQVGPITGMTVNADGSLLAAGGAAVGLWEPASGTFLGTVPAGGFVSSVALDPGGSVLAVGTLDGVNLFDVATRQQLRTLTAPSANTTSIAFDPTGSMLAAGNFDGSILLWDPATGRRLAHLPGVGVGAKVISLAFSPDSSTLAAATDNGVVKLWDARAGQEGRTIAARASAVAFNPVTSVLATAGYDGTVTFWDASTGQRLRDLVAHQGSVKAVAFSPDGSRLASAGGDRTVSVWSLVPVSAADACEMARPHVSAEQLRQALAVDEPVSCAGLP